MTIARTGRGDSAGEAMGFTGSSASEPEPSPAPEKDGSDFDLERRRHVDLLSLMSHEIRTPLNAIQGAIEILGETPLSPEQQNLVFILRRSSSLILDQVTNVLDYSKGMSGLLRLEEVPFDLEDLVEDTIRFLGLSAHEKRLELVCRWQRDVPTWLIGDPGRFRQVLVNLVGNAIKFTSKGEVVVDVGSEELATEEIRLHVSVRDTGIGVPQSSLETIFEPFTQVDSSTTRKFGGTGLGLSIAKQIVVLMGGRIWAGRNPAGGTCIQFFVHLRRQPQTSVAIASPRLLAGKRVLVVDDTAATRAVLHEELVRLGACVVEAESALHALAELRGRPRFDWAFLDCRMPSMGGFDLAERLGTESPERTKVIMMLPTNHRSGDLDRVHTLGLAACLYKPVTRRGILEALHQGSGGASSIVEAPPPAIEDPHVQGEGSGLRILLAEDNPDNRTLVRYFLKKTPHQIVEAENGRVAVSHYQEERYDLVLMDLHMPVMDGFAAIAEIRKHETSVGITAVPILVLSGSTSSSALSEAVTAGASGYLRKPLGRERLLDAIRDVVQGQERAA